MTSSFSETKGFFCFSCNKRSPEDALGKQVFSHGLFLKNEVQINKNNYRMMLSMSKQISLPKVSSIQQKNKNWSNKRCPFHTKAFNCEQVLPIKPVGRLSAICRLTDILPKSKFRHPSHWPTRSLV